MKEFKQKMQKFRDKRETVAMNIKQKEKMVEMEFKEMKSELQQKEKKAEERINEFYQRKA